MSDATSETPAPKPVKATSAKGKRVKAPTGPRDPSFKPTAGFERSELPDTASLPKPIDWAAIYGRVAPLSVEIGCGGGRTVITMAEEHPEKNYLGIEIAGDYYKLLRERAGKRTNLSNIKTARIDAAYLMQKYFGNDCVDEYHVYFPDPWPKKKHHKRRLFSDQFCADLRRTLKPDGVLWFATDHAEYFSVLLPRLRKTLQVEEHPAPWPDAPGGRTNYEVKYLEEGRPIYRLIGRR